MGGILGGSLPKAPAPPPPVAAAPPPPPKVSTAPDVDATQEAPENLRSQGADKRRKRATKSQSLAGLGESETSSILGN